MKERVLILVLFVFCAITINGLYTPTLTECSEERHRKNFTCVKNDDNTYNVTFDCILNGHEHAELQLIPRKFPKRTKSLNIQNCNILHLATSCVSFSRHKLNEAEDTFTHLLLSHLKIVNITHLVVENKITETINDLIKNHDSFEAESLGSEPHAIFHVHSYTSDSQISVAFENIKNAYFGEGLNFPPGLGCANENNEGLEYFKMINVTECHFRDFSNGFTALKEISIDNVTFIPKSTYAKMHVNNTEVVVTIKNSNLIKMEEFFEGKVFKVK